jgi:hypothetical protein
LEDDEAVDAETFVNKASPLMNSVSLDLSLQLRYRVTYARVLDANRKFIEAAIRYYELSTITNFNVYPAAHIPFPHIPFPQTQSSSFVLLNVVFVIVITVLVVKYFKLYHLNFYYSDSFTLKYSFSNC